MKKRGKSFKECLCSYQAKRLSSLIGSEVMYRHNSLKWDVAFFLLYAMIFLKSNRLKQNRSGCVYHREIMNIASERPLKTIYATFFTFWVAAL